MYYSTCSKVIYDLKSLIIMDISYLMSYSDIICI